MQEKYLSIQTIGSDGKVSLVQSLINGSFYVKKVLDIYEKNVYRWLVDNPINGVPVIREIYEENNKGFLKKLVGIRYLTNVPAKADC